MNQLLETVSQEQIEKEKGIYERITVGSFVTIQGDKPNVMDLCVVFDRDIEDDENYYYGQRMKVIRLKNCQFIDINIDDILFAYNKGTPISYLCDAIECMKDAIMENQFEIYQNNFNKSRENNAEYVFFSDDGKENNHQ